MNVMRARQMIVYGLIALVAVMPFHAFASVWLGSLTGYQTLIQSWKEIVIVLMFVAAVITIWRRPQAINALLKPVNYWIPAFIAVALLVSAITQPPALAWLFGLKTDIEFLVVFLLAQLVASQLLVHKMQKIILITSAAVAGFAVLQTFALPADFLRHFGYGPETIAPFHTIDPGLNTIRVLSTLGGPNQLGSFLILPICLCVAMWIRQRRFSLALLTGLMTAALIFTYSRSALLGLVAAVVTVITMSLPRQRALYFLLATTAAAAIGAQLLFTSITKESNLQYYVFHGSLQETGLQDSTEQHAGALDSSLLVVKENPLGKGLGTAGPASFHAPQAFISENYFLQLAIETGIAGALLFIGFCIHLFIEFWRRRAQDAAKALAGALVGISTINLFLHGWADSSTALVFWSLAGVLIGTNSKESSS
ncbi:MAG TPA: O-antigen ligase family protein [Candidatus Dormibacteraeota bacterium]|nr:O-antigen ligase family protein [Candidatus Dormibacteraeota bacterium]